MPARPARLCYMQIDAAARERQPLEERRQALLK